MSDTKYYAARRDERDEKDDTANASWIIGRKWNVTLLIQTQFMDEGMYDHDDGYRYYVREIEWVEFDMLAAFGVPVVTKFHASFPVEDGVPY